MILIHGIEGHSDLVKLTGRQLTTQTVIYDFNIGLGQFRCFLTPDIRQLAFLEGDRFQLFTLFVIVHAPEDDLIAVSPASELQRGHIYLPIPFRFIPKHTVNSTGQLCKGAVPVCNIGFPDANQVPALILHQTQDVVLGRVNGFSRTS